MDKLDLYYDHYKETYYIHQKTKAARDRYFLILCLLEAFSFYLAVQPEQATTVIHSGIKEQLKASISIGVDILQTLTWIVILYALINYCKDTLHVERQYRYLDKLENEICHQVSGNVFNREGSDYLDNYPVVLNLIDIFYKTICPILFNIINYIRIRREIVANGCFDKASVLCDLVVFIVVFLVTWFFFFEIHYTTTRWLKKKIPIIDYLSQFIHSVLKEV